MTEKKQAKTQFSCSSVLTSGALIPILFLSASLATTSFAGNPPPDADPFKDRPVPIRIQPSPGPQGIVGPKSIAISPDGKLYLSHQSPFNRGQVFTGEGRAPGVNMGAVSEMPLNGSGSAGSKFRQVVLENRKALTADPYGNLYIADTEAAEDGSYHILQWNLKDPQLGPVLFARNPDRLVSISYDRRTDHLYYSTTVESGGGRVENSIRVLNRDGTESIIVPSLQSTPLSFVMDSYWRTSDSIEGFHQGVYYASMGGLKFLVQYPTEARGERIIDSESSTSVVLTSGQDFIIYSTSSGKIVAQSVNYSGERFLLHDFGVRDRDEAPMALALDENDDLYVVHANKNYITKITLNGDNVFAHCHGGLYEGGMLKDTKTRGWFCRFKAEACPTNFVQYRNWSSTSNVTCYGGSSTGCKDGNKKSETGNHDWADLAQEKTFTPQVSACGGANSGHNIFCSAKINQIGCQFVGDELSPAEGFHHDFDRACSDAGGVGLRVDRPGSSGTDRFCKFSKSVASLVRSEDGYITGCPAGWHSVDHWSKVDVGQWWGEVKNIYGLAIADGNCASYDENITDLVGCTACMFSLRNSLESWAGDRTRFRIRTSHNEADYTINEDLPGELFKYCSIQGHSFRDQATPHSCSNSDLIQQLDLFCKRSKHTHYRMSEIGCAKDR